MRFVHPVFHTLLLVSLSLPLLPMSAIGAQPDSSRITAGQARRSGTLTPEDRRIIEQANRDARNEVRRSGGMSARDSSLTEAASATAFASAEARSILYKARAAREMQDSTLRSYKAVGTQRMSVGLGARKLGLEKLLFRGDNVAEISWKRDVGVWVRPLGSRMVVPMASTTDGYMTSSVSIPYFPGREQLWFPSSDFGVVKTEVDESNIIHPLARGAERWYLYEAGDSVDIMLPGDRVIHLKELRIRARKPEWRTFVGSFWFDTDGGQLVRAAYRMSAQMEIWDMAREEEARDRADARERAPVRDSILKERLSPEAYALDSARQIRRAQNDDDDIPAWVSASFRPARASIDAITVEYALFEGRFWLPRAYSATANMELTFMKVPFRIDEKFTYESVDGDFPLPEVPESTPVPEPPGGASGSPLDSAGVQASANSIEISVGSGGKSDSVRSDSARYGLAMARQCAASIDSTWTRVEKRYDGAVTVGYRMPCNMAGLSSSPLLPRLNESDADVFDLESWQELANALSLGLQTPWAPQMPRLRSGADLFRYNRVEGLSVGVEASQVLGAGYTARAEGRLGLADLHANGELALSRSSGARTITASLYHKLNAVNPDWAAALSLGPSLPAFLYGRDEGFYYRSYGISLREQREQRLGTLEYGVFLERQWTAGDSGVSNTFSLARAISGRRFARNIPAEPGSYAGVNGSLSRMLVQHPGGLRITGILRAEAATGTFQYATASVESSISENLGRVRASLTGSAGNSFGRVPVQRSYMLGGLRTVRGEPPAAQSGDAFWFTRAELGTRQGVFRPVVFYDVGWAGSRSAFSRGGSLRGAGAGVSLLDGLLRFDVSRGLGPFKTWRSDFYLEAPI